MKVYKATRPDMTCTMGIGTFQYELGKTYTAEECKCGKTGLHSCEYILDCMGYYPLGPRTMNRFFLAEASGDLHEVGGDDTRVSSTELKLVEELDSMHICYEAMGYMIQHPRRRWEADHPYVKVQADSVKVGGPYWIGIARGYEPQACGEAWSILGLLHEEDGVIKQAKLIHIGGEYRPGKIYKLTKEGELVAVPGGKT